MSDVVPGQSGSVETAPASAAPTSAPTDRSAARRRCAYCGDEFSYQRTANRPPAYCSRTWPEPPRSCQARAKAQRTANKAVGLDVPLATYRDAGRDVVQAVTLLQEDLASHLARVADVEQAALGRIEQAEREAREASERASAAEARRDQAVRDASEAARQRDEASRARSDAERLAEQTRQECEERISAAWAAVAAKEGERAAAVARAEEQAVAAAEAHRLHRAAGERAEQLAAANEQVTARLTSVQDDAARQAAAARADLKAAHDALAETHAGHSRNLAQLRERAEAEATQLKQERDAERNTVQRLGRELDDARRRVEGLANELTAARAATDAAMERVAAAEQRYDQLLAVLRELRSDAAPAGRDRQPDGPGTSG